MTPDVATSHAAPAPRPEGTLLALDEALRVALYRLLARYLDAPASLEDLRAAQALSGDDSPLGRAIDRLAAAAGHANVDTLRDDYQELFIGLSAGEIVPYASHYIAGMLNDIALVTLRRELRGLGLRRRADVRDPEDHAAAVLEAAALAIERDDGANGARASAFIAAHVLTWMPALFADLEAKHERCFYSALGAVGAAFLASETSLTSEENST